MATKTERSRDDSGSKGTGVKRDPARNGARSNGNGNGNGNGAKTARSNGVRSKRSASNGNGNGSKTARSNGARSKRSNGNGHRNGNGNGGVAPAEARRIATEMGSAMLLASSLETARHSDDVELIAGAICEHLGLPTSEQADVLAGARLHDVGKASIPREVLEKPTKLTAKEWELMRTHTTIGEEILSSVPELKGIARLVRHSHERWDGSGYPDGLAGEEIPLGSRIIFCADAFHAIRADRAYRDGVPAPRAMREIVRCSGTQFDPEIVEAFERVIHELRLVPASKRRGKRSSRLTALLLCMALGGGGSAVGHSDLLGDPLETGAEPSAPPVVLDCGRLYCPSVTDLTASSVFGTILGSGPALNSPGTLLIPPAGDDSRAPSSKPGFSVGTNQVGAPGAGKPTTEGSQGGGDEQAPGQSGTDPQGGKTVDKNPDANGNGWAGGHAKNGVPKGPATGSNSGGGSGGSGVKLPDFIPPGLDKLPKLPKLPKP
jgi:HD-GYP domain-containing protein (c-di-GMP phosphodiesterase class II)